MADSGDDNSGCLFWIIVGLMVLWLWLGGIEHRVLRIEKFLKLPPEAEQSDQ